MPHFELGDRFMGHPREIEVQFAELAQSAEVAQALVGNPVVGEVQILESGESCQMSQTGVADRSLAQGQRA